MSEIVLHAPFAGWLSELDEVDDPVFAERMMGEGCAIDPVEGVLRAPADAEVVSVPASAHAVTLRLVGGSELLLHVGLDTVALAGRGFVAAVKPGERVRTGQALINVDLDVVAGAARDLVTPIVAPGEGARVVVDRPGRMVAAGDPIARLTPAPRIADGGTDAATVEGEIVVAAPLGLHARPAARIATLLKRYDAALTLRRGAQEASGRSTVALLALGATAGDVLQVRGSGRDAAAALAELVAFAAERFGDPAGERPAAPTTLREGGVTAAPGLAIGEILHYRAAAITVDAEGGGVAHERAALDTAFAAVIAALPIGESDIIAAHRALLEDPELRAAAEHHIAQGASAGAAWQAAIGAAATVLEETGNPRIAERVADLRDIERQLLLVLSGTRDTTPPALFAHTILVADDLLPSQFLELDHGRLAGIVTARGGPTAHVSILAAGMGVPMVVAAGGAVLAHADGTPAILDADAARLDVAPSPERLAAARERLARESAARVAARARSHEPAMTADGVRIEVFANLGAVADAAVAVEAGAEGCGLLRTEFLFLDRDTAPDEEEQRRIYARIAATLGDRPLIVRTLDIGADKPVRYLFGPDEPNPALGLRGIRLSLSRPDLLDTQLRAVLTAVPGAQCRIMLPMVVDVAEVIAVRARLDAAMAATGRREPVQFGVMVETPAAALLADQLAVYADFLSVGTNDLTQYALAADRGNAAVAGLVDPYHPAVLRLIAHAARGAAAHGRWLGVCGGLASEPRAAPLLIGLGVTELSAVPAAIPAVKAVVRSATMAGARDLAAAALAAQSGAAVRALLEQTT